MGRMVSYEIPFTGQEIDSSDPSGSLMNAGESVASFATLFAVVGAATYGYNRLKAGAGVSGEQNIPGV